MDMLNSSKEFSEKQLYSIVCGLDRLYMFKEDLKSKPDNSEERYKLALRIRDQYIPQYLEKLPGNLRAISRLTLFPSILEQECDSIITNCEFRKDSSMS